MSGPFSCARCGRPQSEHLLANFSDGNLLGREIQICPTATYAAEPDINTFYGENPHLTNVKLKRSPYPSKSARHHQNQKRSRG